jgi:dihydroorotase-like cyclic amidohydrolase
MGVVYTSCVAAGLMDLPRFVEVTSTAAARFLNIYPRYTHHPFFFSLVDVNGDIKAFFFQLFLLIRRSL